MKIVIAPDSFKGSLSAEGVANSIKKGLEEVLKNAEIITLPIADGGEGTLETIVDKKDYVETISTAPNGKKITAVYGRRGNSAVIEMARSAGLTLVEKQSRKASTATTFGVGEQIIHAVNSGFKEILLTAGGSATNDGGAGLFSALGAKFLDENGKEFIPTGGTLKDIKSIDLSGLNPLLKNCIFTIATDVKNTLCGVNGATMVYGKQKGATEEELSLMEEGMQSYAKIICDACGKRVDLIEGSGAGGGVAVPLLAFFGAKICSGIDAVLNAVNFNEEIKNADIVITGEGKIDRQSLFGKAISGVCDRANKNDVPVYCFVGGIGDKKEDLLSMGIKDIFTVSERANGLEDAINNAEKYLYDMAKDFAKKFNVGEI